MSDHTPDVPHKQCSKCKKLLPATAEYFSRRKSKPSGLNYVCKGCVRAKARAKWKELNPPPPPKEIRPGLKQCSKCKEWLPANADYFHRNIGHSDGLLTVCITCRGFTKREELVAKEGFKICRVCREEKPATEEFFGVSNHLAHRPFRYFCRACESRKAMNRYNKEKEERGIQIAPIKLKQCRVCKQLLDRTEENFRRRNPSSPNLHHTCRRCEPPKQYRPSGTQSSEGRPVDQVKQDRAEQAANMERERQAAIGRGILNPKRCSKCKEWKPATNEHFHNNKNSPDRLTSACKQCEAQRQRNSRDRASAAGRRWREKNADAVRKFNREYKRRKPNNPETRRAWEEKNREKLRINVVNRVAKRASLPHDFTAKDWKFALDYFGGCCAVCGRPPGLFHTLAMDHFYALSKPECIGTLPKNILPLCHGQGGCNNEKHNRDPEEWLTEKLGKRKAKEMLAKIQEFFSKVRQV